MIIFQKFSIEGKSRLQVSQTITSMFSALKNCLLLFLQSDKQKLLYINIGQKRNELVNKNMLSLLNLTDSFQSNFSPLKRSEPWKLNSHFITEEHSDPIFISPLVKANSPFWFFLMKGNIHEALISETTLYQNFIPISLVTGHTKTTVLSKQFTVETL